MKGGESMATEPFLINPPKKLRKRKRNPVGETLITLGANPMETNPWYGDSRGHRLAALMRWGKIPKGSIKRKRKHVKKVVKRTYTRKIVRRKRGRWAPKHIRIRRKIAKQAFWATKYGHMLSHPHSKKVYTRKGFVTMATKHKRRKRNSWFGQPRRHRKASKKGWRRGHMLSAGKRRKRVRHNFFANPVAVSNPRKRHKKRSHKRSVGHRRSHRRNPAIMAEFGKFTSSVMNVREWAPLAITGGLSAVTGAVVPSMLGVYNPWAKLGVQAAVAIGGGIVVERFVSQKHGQTWTTVGMAMVGYQLLKQFVFIPYFPQFAVGLGDYNDYYPVSAYDNADNVSQQVGAFPNQMSAFPSGISDYPGVGGDNVGAYPYDGAGY